MWEVKQALIGAQIPNFDAAGNDIPELRSKFTIGVILEPEFPRLLAQRSPAEGGIVGGGKGVWEAF